MTCGRAFELHQSMRVYAAVTLSLFVQVSYSAKSAELCRGCLPDFASDKEEMVYENREKLNEKVNRICKQACDQVVPSFRKAKRSIVDQKFDILHVIEIGYFYSLYELCL